jgi:hypothetical protein
MKNLSDVIRHAALLATLVVGCGGSSKEAPDAPACVEGATECRADGLYTCDAGGAFQRTEACMTCEATPVPHCAMSCADAGVTSICQGDSIMSCANNTTTACDPGTCLPAGKQAVCATRPNMTECAGRRTNGTPYDLLCADAAGISTTKACDLRTGECVAAQYDCAALTTVPANTVQCDATSGNYYTSCVAGQPAALACSAGSKCASDGSFNCYTPPTAGAACGGPTVCYPGLHCTQTAPASSSCVQPPGQLACSSTDVLAVCNDVDTGVACVNGAVWWWDDLTAWGGSCTNNHVNLPLGGTCIPGLADCQQGLACDKSPFDVAGTCRVPAPNAPPECTLTGQVSTGLSCIFEWHACADGRQYEVNCRRQNIGGTAITICECSVNGAVTTSFGGTELCMATNLQMLDQLAMSKCGWNVTTVDVAE